MRGDFRYPLYGIIQYCNSRERKNRILQGYLKNWELLQTTAELWAWANFTMKELQ